MDTSYIKNLKTPIAVVGLGKSGTSALNLLKEFGLDSSVMKSFDEKNKDADLQSLSELLAFAPNTIVVSPGVSLHSEWIKKIISSGVHLTSEISLAASLLTSEKLIGVTGSVGKSTIVSLLGAGALAFDETAFVGGNLGTPFCDYALRLLRGGPVSSWVILELSSYQLENCVNLSLDFSIISYLSPNHLERYESLEDYYQTKLKITSITKNLCLFSKTAPDCEKYAAYSKSKYKLINAENFSHQELLPKILLIGKHNKDNFALAAEMAHICNWPENSYGEMQLYRGLPHRLEFVAEINGVSYINDSKATAMDSVLVATRGCLDNIISPSKLFLLLGGKDKNLPWTDLSILSQNTNIAPVFFGACGLQAKEQSGLAGEYFEKLGSAINFCQKRAQRGDAVLLSPGGTSLDEFKNFEERGDFFKTLVLNSLDI